MMIDFEDKLAAPPLGWRMRMLLGLYTVLTVYGVWANLLYAARLIRGLFA